VHVPNAANSRLRIAAARAHFLSTGTGGPQGVSDLVAASWRRSYSAGVDAAASVAAYHDNLDVASRLMRCSQPIVSRLSEETADLPLSIAVTDSKARILSRSDTDRTIGMLLDNVSFAPGFEYAEGGVGTNGVGTVFESGQPIHIVGPEHFHERLQPFACAGAPIRDPLTGRVEGVLDISCLTEHSSPLMHSIVRSAAHDIERNLLLDRSQCQQALFETFIRLDSRTRGAVLAVGGEVVMGNALAQSLFDPADQQTLQQHARYLMTRSDQRVDEIELPSGKTVRMRGTRIVVGNDIAGMVLEINLLSEGMREAPEARLPDETLPPPPSPEPNASIAGLRRPVDPMSNGRSPLWRRACEGITTALTYHDALLVMGETGSGKFSLVTEIYHRVHHGGRSIAFDAADISRESYADAEEALDATTVPTLCIFRNIDELSTAGVDRLNSLLQVIAESDRPVSVAATLSDANIDSDLPFRDLLGHFQQAVTVPPLRHRVEDLAAVVTQVLANVADRRGVKLSPAAMRVISGYSWPRNVSQLEEALEAALLKRPVGEIQPEDLPGYCHHTARRRLSGLEALERDAIVKALHDAEGNRVQAAAALGISRASLYRKLKSFGITTI
jgi:transcriptional regulator of acetoin/glycerol metabolism